ncbi:MAG: hypothetical protein M1816_006334 [Peltula sp. TS41687]|nr:MAG: hypothetical protein M1816_006334 [Peltula sp. TS41687]
MPAPLAKGIIIAASVLVAAGIAAYENEQVQAWLERTRRKIASAIYNVGEDVHRASQENEKIAMAVEAAKKKRDEVLATSRELFVRQLEKRNHHHHQARQNQQPPSPASTTGRASFDDFLKGDDVGAYTLHNRSAEPQVTGTTSIRPTHADVVVPSVGTNEGAPRSAQTQILFDATAIESEKSSTSDEHASRESSATLGGEQARQGQERPEPLIRIHSGPHSDASSVMVTTPTSTAASVTSLSEEDTSSQAPLPPSTSTYFSVNEWAEHMSPAFYTTPQNTTQLDHLEVQTGQSARASSTSGSMEFVAENGSVGGESRASDIISDTSGMRTPGTWTEVGSEVSEGDIGGQ